MKKKPSIKKIVSGAKKGGAYGKKMKSRLQQIMNSHSA